MSNLSIDFNTIISGTSHKSLVTVTVDTVTAVTPNEVPNSIFNKLVQNSREAIAREGYYIHQFYDKNQRLWFKRLPDKRVMFSGSPTRSRTIPSFLELVQDLLGPWALEAKITRLDCTITLPVSFEKVFVGLDFGKRRSCERYKSNAYGNTFYVGRAGRRYEIVIYDKRKERKAKAKRESELIKYPCTRIEINSLPKKGMLLRELPLVREHRPFKGITWYNVNLFPPANRRGAAFERFVEFRTLLNQEGFFRAKRILRLRSNRNFNKQYGEFYQLQEVTPSLDEIFQTGIGGMFHQ